MPRRTGPACSLAGLAVACGVATSPPRQRSIQRAGGHCMCGLGRHSLPRLPGPASRHWLIAQSAGSGIASWQSPTGNSADSSLCRYRPDLWIGHHGSRSLSPNRETFHTPASSRRPKFPGLRSFHNQNHIPCRSAIASISRYCADANYSRRGSGSARRSLPPYSNRTTRTSRPGGQCPSPLAPHRSRNDIARTRRHWVRFQPVPAQTSVKNAAQPCRSIAGSLPWPFIPRYCQGA